MDGTAELFRFTYKEPWADLLKLLRKSVQFEWTQQCEKAMRRVVDSYRCGPGTRRSSQWITYGDRLLRSSAFDRRTEMANNSAGAIGGGQGNVGIQLLFRA